MTTLWPSPKILAFNVLTRNVPIPDEVKKFNSIFISIQLSEMNGSLRVKIFYEVLCESKTLLQWYVEGFVLQQYCIQTIFGHTVFLKLRIQ